MLRQLLLLEKGTVYNERGEILSRGDSENAIAYLKNTDSSFLVECFNDVRSDSLTECLVFGGEKVIANRRGEATCARLKAGRESRWIVSKKSWGIQELHPRILRELREFYEYYGIGYKPTPSSLGTELMRQVWQQERLARHTAPSISCERFIRKHHSGGIVQTPGKGRKYNELLMLDMSSAWVSHFVLHPTGTAVPFQGPDNTETFFTYFAECEVLVTDELPLGPFPYRTGSKDGKRVIYPTLPGVYKKVYLWKEQVSDCKRAGCFVRIIQGYGWNNYTTDSLSWAERAFVLRRGARTNNEVLWTKKCAVAAIGHHAQPREYYYLSPEEGEEGCELVDSYGNAFNIYLRKEKDLSAALMIHWYAYTIAMCNRHVYQFALPFAKEGRLVSIDYDSILIVEKDERHTYVARKDFEALDLPPGTWLWILLHDVEVLNDRSFRSRELTKTPGISH